MTSTQNAVAWSAVIGLVPGYNHTSDPEVIANRRDLLIKQWQKAMDDTLGLTGYVVSATLTDTKVLYPSEHGGPEGGEAAVTFSGSSNPNFVKPRDFDDFIEAVKSTVLRVQRGMKQETVRIEFTYIDNSVYSRLDKADMIA